MAIITTCFTQSLHKSTSECDLPFVKHSAIITDICYLKVLIIFNCLQWSFGLQYYKVISISFFLDFFNCLHILKLNNASMILKCRKSHCRPNFQGFLDYLFAYKSEFCKLKKLLQECCLFNYTMYNSGMGEKRNQICKTPSFPLIM